MCRDTDRVCPKCRHEVNSSNLVDGDNLVGLRLADKYELVEFLGEGAMGWVYRGTHLALESSVAVKIMKPQVRPDENRSARFKREARAASRLNNPHIISVIDFGETPSGLLYLVTEYLRGEALTDLLHKEELLAFKRAVRILSQILSALEESHNCGVVHRDLKPDNIMVSQLRGGEDFVKVLDFGIAQIQDKETQKLTQQGQLFGTPDYMAPEQVRTQEITGAADLYAAGVILFEMLTGRLPFQAESLFDVLKDHLYTAPPKLSEVAPEMVYPTQLQEMLDKALEKEPKKRFANAGEFRRALRKAARLTTGEAKPCPRCNQLVEKKVQFCPHCGHRLQAPKKQKPKRSMATAVTQYAMDNDEGKPSEPRPLSDSQPTLDRLWSSLTVRLPLVDRKEERTALKELLEGHLAVVQLVGTVGMGKTALARYTAREARSLGLPVHWVEPHKSLLPVSWAPVRQTVASVLGLSSEPTEADLRSVVGTHEDLIREYHGLSELFGHGGPLQQADATTRRDETIASAWKTVLSKTATPRLIVFEDIDLYDTPSRLFVERLSKNRGQGSNLAMVVTSTVPILESSPKTATLELKPLDNRTVSVLIGELFSRPTDSWGGIMSTLVSSSQGNPLWLEQALALASESGTESDQALPDLVSTRLSRLPSKSQQILQALAVLGMESTINDVAFLIGETSLDEASLHLLSLRGFLLPPGDSEPSPSPPDRTGPEDVEEVEYPTSEALKFTHPFLVPIIRETLPAEVRLEYNKRCAQLYEAQSVAPEQLARHLLEAGRENDALRQYEIAGDEALRYSDAFGAIEHYRKAVDIARWNLLMSEDDPSYLTLNAKLGESMNAAGDFKGAHVVLKYAVSNSAVHPENGAKIRRFLSKVLVSEGRPAKAVETLRSAIGDAILQGDAEVLTEMYLELADLLVHSGDKTQALQELKEGLDMVTLGQGPMSASGPQNLWKMLLRMAEIQNTSSTNAAGIQSALKTASSALHQAERVSSPLGMARTHLLLAELAHKAERSDEVDPHLHAALKTLRHLGDRRGQAECLLRAATHGKNGKARAYIQEAYQLAWEIGWTEGMKRAGAQSSQSDQVA